MATTRPPADTPITPDEIAAIRAPFRKATLLPARAYHDESIHAWETEHIFLRDWIAVGRARRCRSPAASSCATSSARASSLVRGRDDVVRAFYNVCRHRGTAVEERECGKAVRFQCPYHAWIYDLDGRLIRARHVDDLEDFSFEASGLTPIRCETWQGFVFLCFADEATTPDLRTFMGDWFDHHAGFGRDMSTLRRAARLTYEVRGQLEDRGRELQRVLPLPAGPPAPQQADALRPGRGLPGRRALEGRLDGLRRRAARRCRSTASANGRPLLYARDEIEARRIFYYILWPNLIVSVHPDYVLTHQAWPDGPNRSTVHCDLYVEAADLGTVDVSGAVAFWDITNKEDYHVVELQQQGTRSRSWTAGRYSNQEASVHAFDLMVADRYAMDGVRTIRGWRTEVEGAEERRLRARAKAAGGTGAGASVRVPATPPDED